MHPVQDIDPMSANFTQEVRNFLSQTRQLESGLVWMALDVSSRLGHNGTTQNHVSSAQLNAGSYC